MQRLKQKNLLLNFHTKKRESAITKTKLLLGEDRWYNLNGKSDKKYKFSLVFGGRF